MVNQKLSVIICTYNRANLLRSAIQSLLEQSLEMSKYVIIVVDNASTDDTSAVVREFQRQCACPQIILAQEPRQGLGHARNTACQIAKTAYVAFMDDDCMAAPVWLESVLNSFENVRPTPWSVGGPVLPLYNGPKPVWFKDTYETDTWGDRPRFLKKGESFTGCNMSFRKDVIARFGGFDVALGMNGEKLALAEETKLYRRIWSAGDGADTLYYTPGAIVYHFIDPYKTTVSYQLARAFSSGQASWSMAKNDPTTRRIVLCIGSLALMFWYAAKALLRYRLSSSENWAVEQLYPVASNIGRLAASLGIWISFRQRQATNLSSN